ncbi:unnamed protein product [Amoebophrya sp. A120]|nr:unnamed protein product [Amoebophrya sp. A120]|eukprot:GSA120T00014451001.1
MKPLVGFFIIFFTIVFKFFQNIVFVVYHFYFYSVPFRIMITLFSAVASSTGVLEEYILVSRFDC